jgi:hypothetical protein
MHESGALYVLIAVAFVISSLLYCEYQMTKKALIEITGKEPSANVIWYAMTHSMNINSKEVK